MKNLSIFFRMLALISLTSGCTTVIGASAYETTITFNKEGTLGAPHNDWDEQRYSNALFGLIEVTHPIPLDELCPAGVSYIEQNQTDLDILSQNFTLGFYVPITVSVFCNEQIGMEVDLDAQGRAVAIRPLQH